MINQEKFTRIGIVTGKTIEAAPTERGAFGKEVEQVCLLYQIRRGKARSKSGWKRERIWRKAVLSRPAIWRSFPSFINGCV